MKAHLGACLYLGLALSAGSFATGYHVNTAEDLYRPVGNGPRPQITPVSWWLDGGTREWILWYQYSWPSTGKSRLFAFHKNTRELEPAGETFDTARPPASMNWHGRELPLAEWGDPNRPVGGADYNDPSRHPARRAQKFGGESAGMDPEGKGLLILRAMPQSPTDGLLQPNDVLTSIDGVKFENMDNRSALLRYIQTVQGRLGKKVRVSILRNRQPLEFDVQIND